MNGVTAPLRRLLILAAATLVVAAGADARGGQAAAERQMATGNSTMSADAPHPGMIKRIDVFTNEVKMIPHQEVPPRQQFVMLDSAGVETSDPALAVRRVPIVEVHVMTLDAEGKLAPIEQAKRMRILEYGEGQRLLRSTLMIRD